MKCNLSDLQGIKHEIAESLVATETFKNDERFSVSFKGNLIIVLSRIIFIQLKSIAHKSNLKVEQLDLTDLLVRKIIISLKNELMPDNRIKSEYLGKLYDIELREFNRLYKKFQSELKSDRIYSESFDIYLYWLVGNIYDIVSGKCEVLKDSPIEQTLFWNFTNLKNDEMNVQKENSHEEDKMVEINNYESGVQNINGNIKNSEETQDHQENISLLKDGSSNQKKSKVFMVSESKNSDFDVEYYEKVRNLIESITSELNIDKRNDVQKRALLLLDDVMKNGLGYKDLRPSRNPIFLGLSLIYFSLKSLNIARINDEKISVNSIVRSCIDYLYDLGLPKSWKTSIVANYLYEFLSKKYQNLIQLKAKKSWVHIKTLEQAAEELFKIKTDLGIKENRPPNRTELEESGNIGFLNIFKGKNFTFNDAVRKAELIPNYNPQKWSWLNGDDCLDKAAKYFRKIYDNYLAEDLGLTNNQAPKRDNLKKNGPTGFYHAVIDKGYTYTQLVKAAGLIPNIEPLKWRNFNIKKAKDHLVQIIESGILDHLNLTENQAPTIQQLIDSGQNDFVQKILKSDFTYNDILRLADLDINHEVYKYAYYEFNDFVALFLRIMDSEIILKLNLNPKEAPTIQQLYDLNFGFFPSAIWHKNIRYNQILAATGYLINHEYNKYFNYLEKDFISELSKAITNPKIRNFLSLKDKEAPTLKQLIYLGFGDIIHQIIDRKISYNEIVKKCELIPNVYQTLQEIGRLLHWILEFLIIRFSETFGWDAYYEVCPNVLINRNQVDISIILPNSQNISFSDFLMKNHILLNFDITMTSDDDFLVEKCLRGYHSHHKFLIIICLYSSIETIKSIRERVFKKISPNLRKNLLILNTEEFLKILNLPIDLKKDINRYIKIAKSAIHDENEYKKLEFYSYLAEKDLRSNYSDRSKKNFENTLRSLNLFHILRS